MFSSCVMAGLGYRFSYISLLPWETYLKCTEQTSWYCTVLDQKRIGWTHSLCMTVWLRPTEVSCSSCGAHWTWKCVTTHGSYLSCQMIWQGTDLGLMVVKWCHTRRLVIKHHRKRTIFVASWPSNELALLLFLPWFCHSNHLAEVLLGKK